MALPLLSDGVSVSVGASVDARDYEDALAAARADAHDLRGRLQRAQTDLSETKLELAKAKHVLAGLKSQLSPLHHALRGVFGELDLVDLPDLAPTPAPAPTFNIGGGVGGGAAVMADPKRAAWESWKGTFGGKTASAIDAFLVHGALTRDQLRVIVKCGWSSIDKIMSNLQGKSLLVKDGTKYRLKEL